MPVRMPGGRALLLPVCLACVLGDARSSAGAPPVPMAKGKADALVQRGVAALTAGDLAAAEQALGSAYKQDPRAELLFQLGRLAMAQGQLLTAQDLFRRYLNDPTAPADTAKAAEAQKVLAQPRPPSGKVRVQGDRGGFVLLDGRILGRLPLVQPLLASPGAHTVAIQYPGKALDVPVDIVTGRMVDIRCTRATGAIVLSMLPALLVLPELSGVSPATSEQLLDAVERAAQGEQLTILKPETASALVTDLDAILQPAGAPPGAAPADLAHCLSQADCLQRFQQKTKLEFALRVRASVTPVPPPAATAPTGPAGSGGDAGPQQWEVNVELLHATIFGAAVTRTQSCAPCTDQKAASALQEAVSRALAVGLVRPRGTLVVHSQPADAEVWLGEHRLGRTPLSMPAWVGEYAVTLRLPNHEPAQRTMQVEAGKTTEVAANLPEVAPPPPAKVEPAPPPEPPLRWERAPRPRWRIAVGIAAVAAGVGLIIGGGVELGMNVMCVPSPMSMPMPNGDENLLSGCTTNLQDIAAAHQAGVGLTIVGGVLTLGGIGLLAAPGPRRQVRAAPAPR